VADRTGLALADVVAAWTPTGGFERTSLSLGQLGRLLYFTNGVTERRREWGQPVLLRAAPSAGALYAGEVYVVALRVRDLIPGVYYYAVHSHRLVEVRRGLFTDTLRRAVERSAQLSQAPAVVGLTNVFARYTHRYANRGYRYALIDSGHIGENLRLAAASAGLGEQLHLRFHDDLLAGLLEVDGREEALCALHAVGVPATTSLETAPAANFIEKRTADSPLDLSGSAPERYHEATKLVSGSRLADRTRPTARDGAPAPWISLPAAAAPSTSVEAAIHSRRSARRFSNETLARSELAFALEMAHGHPALARAEGVELYVVVNRVADLAAGVYRYGSRERGLIRLRSGDQRRALVRACGGQQRAGAAVAFVMVAPISDDRGYRDHLIEAGAVAQRIYLAAEALGHAARNLAAFFDQDLNALLGVDDRKGAVHLTAFGPGE
jgi:SagB-type dehydrogenase family enzyme